MSGAEMFGFNNALQAMRALKANIQRGADDLMDDSLTKAVSTVKYHIISQDLGWRPLAPATVSRKGNAIILIDTSTYLKAIRAWRPSSFEGYAGVKSTDMEANGTPLSEVAAKNEYGDAGLKIPARPLWRPSSKELLAWRRGLVTDKYTKRVRESFTSV